uniref:Uncharacterized protein n=1 Tax=Anguilla anguilla TaxID=7936 RepID=A0A0E9SK72_ANGAN
MHDINLLGKLRFQNPLVKVVYKCLTAY